MKTYMQANREEPDSVFHRLALQKRKRNMKTSNTFILKWIYLFHLEKGLLFVDEVKVSASIYWYVKSNKFVGHELSLEDKSSLHDIFQEINPSCKIRKHHIFFCFYGETLLRITCIIGSYLHRRKLTWQQIHNDLCVRSHAFVFHVWIWCHITNM